MKKAWSLLFITFFLLLSCAIYPEKSNLSSEDKEFLSTVRYIISTKERKAFLSLPSSERKAFIEGFWKKRDPDPDTPVNEYKEEYYKRIKEAKHLFTEGGTSGWVQDRGRVYILLGPPEQRDTYPRGYDFYGPPMEIWHYGFYQLVFVDYRWNGNYELQPQSARMIAEINVAQVQLKPEVKKEEKAVFDFNLDFKKISERELALLLSIPYKNIWFSIEGNELKTTMEVSLEIFDASGKKAWEETKSYPISVNKERLKDFLGKDYLIEISIHLEPGEYDASITLKNLAEKTQVEKKIKLTV
jgi:GWxTD domain-containing protein